MAIEQVYAARCDDTRDADCLDGDVISNSYEAAKEMALKRGWKIIDNDLICPNCIECIEDELKRDSDPLWDHGEWEK